MVEIILNSLRTLIKIHTEPNADIGTKANIACLCAYVCVRVRVCMRACIPTKYRFIILLEMSSSSSVLTAFDGKRLKKKKSKKSAKI